MKPLYPDKVWYYKNFNMVTELDIAGEFIYDGIHALNQMKVVNESALLFSFMYHTAVGIERLQKIVIVLFETIDLDDCEEFEKGLITHSHTGLHERIIKKNKVQFIARENRFLHMLTEFYKSARYDRFNLNSQFDKEQDLFSSFLKEHIENSKIEYHPFQNDIIVVTPYIKEILGRTIGSIAQKYYNLIRKGCMSAGTFTYELRPESKAEKVFLNPYNKHSLQEQKSIERIALKELLVCLRNTNEKHPLLHYINSITPLPFDLAFFNGYIDELSAGTIPQALVDEVETLYKENRYYSERKEEIDAIGNPCVDFEYYAVHQCFMCLENLLNGKSNCQECAETFLELFEMVDEEEYDFLDEAPSACRMILGQEISDQEFVDRMKPIHAELKKNYNIS